MPVAVSFIRVLVAATFRMKRPCSIRSLLFTLAAFGVSLLLSACSPYTAQLKSLDQDYRAGRIPVRDYHVLRGQMLQADAQWRATRDANLNAFSANLNQSTANLNQINAYNARSRVLALPQQVNVQHSGYINQNVRVQSGGVPLLP